MKWWREARFGLFIHWGLYSILGGRWGGRSDHGEWIMETAQIPVDEYEKLLNRFDPTAFDAAEWARLAKEAGMKYVVMTTKHHDGFALYDSEISDYDVMETPFQRDIMRELASAVREEGLTPCWYHSIMDWHHPDYQPARAWNPRQKSVPGSMDRYNEYLRAQVSELLSNYGQIGVMWFDGEWEDTWNDGYGKPLYELCRSLKPDLIVNNRVSNNRLGSMEDSASLRVGDFTTPEQHIPDTGLAGVDWETCMTMNDNWGWNEADQNWKSSEDLIRKMVDVVSKGGNFLLNVGPKPDGSFPSEAVERLRDIGKWMSRHSESIYGTTASCFESLQWGRSTTRGDEIYLHIFDWPTDGRLLVPGMFGSAEMLWPNAPLRVEHQDDHVVVVLADRPDTPVPVVRMRRS